MVASRLRISIAIDRSLSDMWEEIASRQKGVTRLMPSYGILDAIVWDT